MLRLSSVSGLTGAGGGSLPVSAYAGFGMAEGTGRRGEMRPGRMGGRGGTGARFRPVFFWLPSALPPKLGRA